MEFKAYAQKEDYLEVLFGELKAFKRSLEDKTEAGETMKTVPQTPINIFSHQIEAFTAASEQKQKAGLLTRQEKYRCADIAADMNRYLQTVKAELLSGGDEIFDRFRELFGDERTELEDLCAHAGQTLEYAFDFMEGTFGSSQEMVVFITELNSSAPAVRFLQENECERYFEYNKNLLFDERRADISEQAGQTWGILIGKESDHMEYEGTVYRPPSEARSLIIQVTVGCAHNRCTFCNMYRVKKFRVRTKEEIMKDLDECRDYYGPYVSRVFFADGDALVVKTELLLELLAYVHKNFPYVERITSYGTAKDVLAKSEEDLKALAAAGLEMVYIGAESGETASGDIHKDVTAARLRRRDRN